MHTNKRKPILYLSIALLVSGCATQKNTCIDLTDIHGRAESFKHKRIGHSQDGDLVFTDLARGGNADYPLSSSTNIEPVDIPQAEYGCIEGLNSASSKTLSRKEIKVKLQEWKEQITRQQLENAIDTLITDQDRREARKAKTLGIISFVSSFGAIAALIMGHSLFIPLTILTFITGIWSIVKYRKTSDKRLISLPAAGMILSGVTLAVIIFLLAAFYITCLKTGC